MKSVQQKPAAERELMGALTPGRLPPANCHVKSGCPPAHAHKLFRGVDAASRESAGQTG
jgi:hypothetical protein